MRPIDADILKEMMENVFHPDVVSSTSTSRATYYDVMSVIDHTPTVTPDTLIEVYFEPWIFSKYGYKAKAVLLESYDEKEYTIEQVVGLIKDRMRQNNLNVVKEESETEVLLSIRIIICESAIYNLGRYIIKKEKANIVDARCEMWEVKDVTTD